MIFTFLKQITEKKIEKIIILKHLFYIQKRQIIYI